MLGLAAIRTDPDLIRRLEACAGQPMTKAEIRAQRISFVFGQMPVRSNVTHEEVEAIIARMEGI